MIDFVIQNWKWMTVVAVVLLFLFGLAAGGNSAIPSAESLKNWSIQEAVFYGCLLIAFAIFIKG